MIEGVTDTAPDGAYVIGGNWGQDVDDTEAGFKQLFAVPAPTLANALDLYQTNLAKLPLDALKTFEPLIPGGGLFDTVGNAIDSIMGALVDVPMNILQQVLDQILAIFGGDTVDPINDAVQGVKDFFDNLGVDLAAKATQDDLAALQDRTQDLEGIIGYGHGYCNAGISLAIGAIKYGVDVQVGPAEGVTLTDGAWVLGSKGLWVADARVTFDPAGELVGEDTEVKIRVYNPSGGLHFEATNVNRGAQRQTLTLHVPFTVPTSGYKVELWVAAAAFRNVGTGSYFNGLSVEKRSTETS